VRLTIHNAGPDPAEQTIAFVFVSGVGDKSGRHPLASITGSPPAAGRPSRSTVGGHRAEASITAILTVKAHAAAPA
jgi:hypothetical protein